MQKRRKKPRKCPVYICCAGNTTDSDDDTGFRDINEKSDTNEVTPEELPERTVASITKDIMERNKHLFEYPKQNRKPTRSTCPKQKNDAQPFSSESEGLPRRKETNPAKNERSYADHQRTQDVRRKRVKDSKAVNRLENPVKPEAYNCKTTEHDQLHRKYVKNKDLKVEDNEVGCEEKVYKQNKNLSLSSAEGKSLCTDKASSSFNTKDRDFKSLNDNALEEQDAHNDKFAGETSMPLLKVPETFHQKEGGTQSEGLKEADDQEDKTIIRNKNIDPDTTNGNVNPEEVSTTPTMDNDNKPVEPVDEGTKQRVSVLSPGACTVATGTVDSSSEDCSEAKNNLKDHRITSICTGPKEKQCDTKVPLPPTQPPQSHRRTLRRASKPRVQTELKEEIVEANSTKDTENSSPTVGSSHLRQETNCSDMKLSKDIDSSDPSHHLAAVSKSEDFTKDTDRSSSTPAERSSDFRQEMKSPEIKMSRDSDSADSSHHLSKDCKSEDFTKERRSPPDLRPSDLREEMTISPGLRLTYESSSCDSANQEELPILPETSTKTKTPEERFSSLPNPFGKNPVLETKLPNRFGSSSLVLGAIGSQNTPEKVPTPSQNRPAARRLDFSKHLMMRQDKRTAVESSSEESLQEKGLDDLLKPESKNQLMNKTFSRLSQSAFPTSPIIKMKEVETKPAWSFYDKDFTSKPAIRSGFRQEVRAKPAAAAAPRTRDLPPPQPRDYLLAPSLFRRRPGKDLPPVMGKVTSPRQPQPCPTGKMLSGIPTSFPTSPTFNQPSPSNQMQDPYIHNDYNPCAERVRHHSPQQMRSKFQPIPSSPSTLHKSIHSSPRALQRSNHLNLLPLHQPFESTSPSIQQPCPSFQMQDPYYDPEYHPHHSQLGSNYSHTIPEPFSQKSIPFHPSSQLFSHSGPHPSNFSGYMLGYEDDLSPRHLQNPNTMQFHSSPPRSLLKREKSRRYD